MFYLYVFITLICLPCYSPAKSNKTILARNFNRVGRLFEDKQELDLLKKSPTTRIFVDDIIHEEISLKNGIIIEQSHAKDVVSFIDRLYGHEASTEIWKNNVKCASLDQATKEGNLIEMLVYLKMIPDAKKRIDWLEKRSQEGHVVCMFELCKELAEDADHKDKKLIQEKVISWFTRAMVRLMQDVACHKDLSVQTALDDVISVYLFILKDLVTIEQKDLIEAMKDSFDWVEKLKKLPSPLWVGYHGMGVFNGGMQPFLEKDWDKQRKDVIKKAKESYAQAVNERH